MSIKNTISTKDAIIMYIVVSLFLFFEMGVQVSPSVMANQLMHDLQLSAFGLGLMSGFYFYSYTAMQIPSGLLFDRFNPRIIITSSLLVCVLGAFLFGFSTNIVFASLARLFMGLGSAFAFVSVLVVTADLFKPRHFAFMTGITQMLGALGAMSGQMPVGLLVSSFGWRYTMIILGLIGLVLAGFIWILLRYEKPTLSQAINKHKTSIKNDLKQILKNKQTYYLALYACFLWASMSGFASLWGVPFLMKADHLSHITAALLSSFMWLGLAIASPFIGYFSTRINNRILPMQFSAFIGLISFGLILFFEFSEITLGILLLFAGAASSGQVLSFTLVKENSKENLRATAIAFNNMAVVISGAIFQPVIGKLIGSHLNIEQYSVGDYRNGLLLIFIAYIGALLMALFFIKKPR